MGHFEMVSLVAPLQRYQLVTTGGFLEVHFLSFADRSAVNLSVARLRETGGARQSGRWPPCDC